MIRTRAPAAALLWVVAMPAFAQTAPAARTQATSVPDPATIERPKIDFTPTAQDALDYDKYFYFQRDDTSFAEAYADVKECDALASGITYYAGSNYNPSAYQYGLAGAVGTAIGEAIADAIVGSAQRRKIRRINIRNCMGFKGYRRYGLRRDLWEAFNFEEGNGRERNDLRDAALLKQALVASGQKPQQTALEQ
jgi:hypothetical protein